MHTSLIEWGHLCTASLAGTPVFNDISAATTPAESLILVRVLIIGSVNVTN